jgi:hypothetical protein
MRKLSLHALVAMLLVGLMAVPAFAKNGQGPGKDHTHPSTIAHLNAHAEPSGDVAVRQAGDWYVVSHEVDATEADTILWREPNVYGGGFVEVAGTVSDLWLYAPGNATRQHTGLLQVFYDVDGRWLELTLQFDEDGVLQTINGEPVEL